MTIVDRTDTTEAVLAALREHLALDQLTNIGFPSTFDFDYAPLWPLFNRVLNNVGDPYRPSAYPANSKALEREVVEVLATMLRAPADDRWGYVTTGGTEGNEYGVLLGRTVHPDAILYHSQAAHYSVPKIADKLRIPSVALRANRDGQLDLDDLRRSVTARRDRAVIVLATIGTTMTEAVDNVSAISGVLNDLAVRRRHIHADAALSGIPLALMEPCDRPGFDLADGAQSVSVSGHKFIGSPFPCGVVITRRSLAERIGAPVDYIASRDSTLGGSRSGHAPLILWYALRVHGADGLRARAQQCRSVAAYAVQRFEEIGWPAWRHPYALTVVLDTPPASVVDKWRLATSQGQSHLVCVPGVTSNHIDALAADLATFARASGADVGR